MNYSIVISIVSTASICLAALVLWTKTRRLLALLMSLGWIAGALLVPFQLYVLPRWYANNALPFGLDDHQVFIFLVYTTNAAGLIATLSFLLFALSLKQRHFKS